MKVDRILETCLYVDDLNAAEKFYRRILGVESFSRVNNRHVFFRCGESMLLLFNPLETAKSSGDVPTHGAHGPGHVAFAIAPDQIDLCRRQLQACPPVSNRGKGFSGQKAAVAFLQECQCGIRGEACRHPGRPSMRGER